MVLKNNLDNALMAVREWHPDIVTGIGMELLPGKRKYLFDFNVRFILPFDKAFEVDFVRTIGFGTRILL